MAEVRASDDRLPWLDAPRPAAVTTPPAARRARGPLLVLLGLFAASVIAVMAFLAGRTTAPDTAKPPAAPRATAIAPIRPQPAIVPVVAPRVEPSTPPIVAPSPGASVTTPHATRARVRRKAAAHRPPPRRARASRKAVVIHRGSVSAHANPAYATPKLRANWPARPFAARGRTVQLGAYLTPALADAAWWRLWRAYPYLGTLPRVVTIVGPSPGRPLYYRLRLAAGSSREARALCNNLHRIGRGCMVVR